ncbi:MAG: zinc-binding dehydrogenase [Nitrososphaeraceae archaeon]
MGRKYDGSYAEYTLVPSTQVIPLKNIANLDWPTLAAIPETFLTAWGSLNEAMDIKNGETLLIRGGTTSVGMAATSIAKELGLTVVATARNKIKEDALLANGADHVIIDDGEISSKVKQIFPGGVNYILELIGPVTLLDSLKAAAPGGIVCDTGIVGGEWSLKHFDPISDIPPTVKLTSYKSEAITADNSKNALDCIITRVANGCYHLNLEKVFSFDEIANAHRYMEENKANGKLVVIV